MQSAPVSRYIFLRLSDQIFALEMGLGCTLDGMGCLYSKAARPEFVQKCPPHG